MKPIYFSTKGEGMNQILEYSSGKINSFITSDGNKKPKGSFDVSSDIYDYFMDSYMVSLMPLKEGFKGSFNVFSGFINKQLIFNVLNVTKDLIYTSEGKYVPAYLVICENAGVKLTMWFDITNNDLVRFIAYLPNGKAFIRDLVYEKKKSELNGQLKFKAYNRNIEMLTENGKEIIRLNEASGAGIAWLEGKEFNAGTIEFDVRGRDVPQKSFVGVAFHGENNETFESVYFRPFNFQSIDPIKHAHAVQYMFEPKFNFQTLRDTRKDEFEAAIVPSNLQATDWFHVKIIVKNNRIKAFVNDSQIPCLDVPTLNHEWKNSKIGFYVGNNSNGDFANLLISNQ